MLSERMQSALNLQIQAELHSAYIYYAMSAYFESQSLQGLAHWMRVQALEELSHAHKFYGFVHDRGGQVVVEAIEQPKSAWESPLEAFQDAHKHECYISKRINELVDLAIEERDHAANTFLQWFVEEQVEEEAAADEMVQKLELVKGSGSGLFMIDQECKSRVFTMPTGMSY